MLILGSLWVGNDKDGVCYVGENYPLSFPKQKPDRLPVILSTVPQFLTEKKWIFRIFHCMCRSEGTI